MAQNDVELYAEIKKINAQGKDTSDELIKGLYDKYAQVYEQVGKSARKTNTDCSLKFRKWVVRDDYVNVP